MLDPQTEFHSHKTRSEHILRIATAVVALAALVLYFVALALK